MRLSNYINIYKPTSNKIPAVLTVLLLVFYSQYTIIFPFQFVIKFNCYLRSAPSIVTTIIIAYSQQQLLTYLAILNLADSQCYVVWAGPDRLPELAIYVKYL